MSWLNKLLGQMPAFQDLLIYAAIALVTLTGIVKCLLPLWGTTHCLRRAIRHLQSEAGTKRDKPIWQESLFMGRRLRGAWQHFLQNAKQLDARRLPCNVEDYINDDTVTHGPGNATLAELIPSLLTSLGILGTFMGLMRGLTGLDMSNANTLMSGIPTLLNGMKFAFGTSVAGISGSLAFNMLNRAAQGTSYHAIDDFVEAFTMLAMERPLDNDVQMILQNEDRNLMLSSVTTGLPEVLASSVEGAVTRSMQPVTHSMDAFIHAATKQQLEGVGQLVQAFVSRMNVTLSDQFLQLGETMTAVNQHQRDNLSKVEASMQAASGIEQQAQSLQRISSEVMERFESYVLTLQQASRRDAAFEQESAGLLRSMQKLNEAQANSLKTLQTDQQQLEQAMMSYRRVYETTAEGMKTAGTAMTKASEQLSGSYQAFVHHVVEGVSRTLGMFDQSMQKLLLNLEQQTGGQAGAEQTATLLEMQRLLTTCAEQLSKLTAEEGAQHGTTKDS